MKNDHKGKVSHDDGTVTFYASGQSGKAVIADGQGGAMPRGYYSRTDGGLSGPHKTRKVALDSAKPVVRKPESVKNTFPEVQPTPVSVSTAPANNVKRKRDVIKIGAGHAYIRIGGATFDIPDDKAQRDGIRELVVNYWCKSNGHAPLYPDAPSIG